MNHSLRLTFVGLLSFFCLAMDDTGCASEDSANVQQDRIHTSYWLLYDAQNDTTFARAQFRLGSGVGTTLVLSDGAQVAYGARSMGFNELLDWHETTLAGFDDAQVFSYADLDGSTFVNAFPAITPSELPTSFPATVARGTALEVEWEGPPLADGELMAAVAAHDANRLDFVRWETRERGATSIVLSADGWNRLPPGATVLTLRRWFEGTAEEASSVGGVIRTTYQSAEAIFVLE
ncbi:MAG: hypothetical protein AAGE52_22030 [Myxococcota bacterium]